MARRSHLFEKDITQFSRTANISKMPPGWWGVVIPAAWLMILLPLLILAACGGGGGSGSDGGGTVVGGGTTVSSISGTISPASLGTNVQVALGGPAAAMTTTDASGNYSFPGLSNGSYTVTASGTSLVFSPASAAVTITGSSVSAVNFVATSTTGGGPSTPTTFQISGTVSASSASVNLQGAHVTATNTALAMIAGTAAVDTSGNFVFPGLANGAYTVMPSGGAALIFNPTDRPVTLNGASVTGVNFTASQVPAGGDGTASKFAISGIVEPSALGAGVEVLLGGASTATIIANSSGAFNFSNLANGGYTITPRSASMSFSPPGRSIVVAGDNVAGANFTATTLAFAISGKITTASLGANVQVALGGASTATTTANASGEFMFPGVTDGSYIITPTSSSVTFSPVNKTVIVKGGDQTGVDFGATATPPNTYSISGTLGSGPLGANAQVLLSGASIATTTTNSSGAYAFSGLTNGTYIVTPNSSSVTFAPINQTVVVSNANRAGINFTDTAITYALSGRVTPSSLGANVQVSLSGAGTASTTTNGTGDFIFSGLANGSYTVTPTAASRNFSPTSRSAIVNGANVTDVSFTASAATYAISGTVGPSSLGANVQVSLGGASTATTTTNSSGVYNFAGLANGSYTVTPNGTSLSFNPTNRGVTLAGSNVSNVDFTASTSGSNTIFLDDFDGSTLGSAWTALDRSGPGSQSENLCNKPSAVTVSGGNLVVTTSATPATCGDAVSSPRQYPYTSGSVQWSSLSFTYGTVEIRAKFPPRNTGTWPALWLLGSNCQAANVVNGSEEVPFMGCPAQGEAAYREIDMVECDTRSWCHIVLAQGSFGWRDWCDFPVDANWHVFRLNWTSSALSISIDGAPAVCTASNVSLKGPAFLIMQTQTTTSTGVGGQPNDANLPTTFQVDYVKVTQP